MALRISFSKSVDADSVIKSTSDLPNNLLPRSEPNATAPRPRDVLVRNVLRSKLLFSGSNSGESILYGAHYVDDDEHVLFFCGNALTFYQGRIRIHNRIGHNRIRRDHRTIKRAIDLDIAQYSTNPSLSPDST